MQLSYFFKCSCYNLGTKNSTADPETAAKTTILVPGTSILKRNKIQKKRL
jgi:hypothetical protein